MSNRQRIESYPLHRSPFFRMGRQRDLAPLLEINMKDLRLLVRERHSHYRRKKEEINGKLRHIVYPVGKMRRLHERVQHLFNRIEQPDYLYSPRRERTASKNAFAHRNATTIAKLDIRQFYPSTTSEHVFRFFVYRLGMQNDVAGIMTKICTVDGKLAFGSPLSPVLCSLVHRDLFDRILQICQLHALTMTLWVDDLTVSGSYVSRLVLWKIKEAIRVRGLESHKIKIRLRRLGVTITGIYLDKKGVAAANKLHLSIRDKFAEYDRAEDGRPRLKLVHSLIGKNNHARQIYPADTAVRRRLDRRRDWLHNERRRLQRLPFITKPAKALPPVETGGALPWEDIPKKIENEYLQAL